MRENIESAGINRGGNGGSCRLVILIRIACEDTGTLLDGDLEALTD
ncbi:unannotated protein [freshwater metagenome]|uniref:Unannotated protein n=1 Tax=freshwater metagenome TaxID=449393 RepID=A0A6J6JXN8_9ZZZZ